MSCQTLQDQRFSFCILLKLHSFILHLYSITKICILQFAIYVVKHLFALYRCHLYFVYLNCIFCIGILLQRIFLIDFLRKIISISSYLRYYSSLVMRIVFFVINKRSKVLAFFLEENCQCQLNLINYKRSVCMLHMVCAHIFAGLK